MKTKPMLFAAIAMLMLAGCSKERETPTPDEEQYDICVAGSITNETTSTSCYWKNGERHDLVLPVDYTLFTDAIALHDRKVYVTVGESGGKTNGYSIDGIWHANQMPDEARSMYASPSIGFLDGSLYIAGYYITTANEFIACYWKDGVCHPLDIPDHSDNAAGASLAVSGGSVYIAGQANYGELVGYWIDEIWNPLSLPEGSSSVYIADIACSEGSVYVLGNTSIDQISLWVDGVAQTLSAPKGSECYSKKIAVADGKVYVTGYYYEKANFIQACYWKDGVFHKLDTPDNALSNTYDIEVVEGSVFIAGNYFPNDNDFRGCYWKDGVRVDIPAPEGMDSYVTGIAVVKKQ